MDNTPALDIGLYTSCQGEVAAAPPYYFNTAEGQAKQIGAKTCIPNADFDQVSHIRTLCKGQSGN